MADLFVGYKISRLRRKLNISQEELAERANISVTTVSRIENDKVIMKVDIMQDLYFSLQETTNQFRSC